MLRRVGVERILWKLSRETLCSRRGPPGRGALQNVRFNAVGCLVHAGLVGHFHAAGGRWRRRLDGRRQGIQHHHDAVDDRPNNAYQQQRQEKLQDAGVDQLVIAHATTRDNRAHAAWQQNIQQTAAEQNSPFCARLWIRDRAAADGPGNDIRCHAGKEEKNVTE